MNEEEKILLNKLADAWSDFVKLPKLHDDDQDEFRRAIHAAQNIVMSRPSLRQFIKEKQ